MYITKEMKDACYTILMTTFLVPVSLSKTKYPHLERFIVGQTVESSAQNRHASCIVLTPFIRLLVVDKTKPGNISVLIKIGPSAKLLLWQWQNGYQFFLLQYSSLLKTGSLYNAIQGI